MDHIDPSCDNLDTYHLYTLMSYKSVYILSLHTEIHAYMHLIVHPNTAMVKYNAQAVVSQAANSIEHAVLNDQILHWHWLAHCINSYIS